jgi:hypothetical protein
MTPGTSSATLRQRGRPDRRIFGAAAAIGDCRVQIFTDRRVGATYESASGFRNLVELVIDDARHSPPTR